MIKKFENYFRIRQRFQDFREKFENEISQLFKIAQAEKARQLPTSVAARVVPLAYVYHKFLD